MSVSKPSKSIFPMPDMELMGGVDGARPVKGPPPPPPRIPGLGRPETTRKEAWWERAITWLLSRGEG
jgi:hypothetical protein